MACQTGFPRLDGPNQMLFQCQAHRGSPGIGRLLQGDVAIAADGGEGSEGPLENGQEVEIVGSREPLLRCLLGGKPGVSAAKAGSWSSFASPAWSWDAWGTSSELERPGSPGAVVEALQAGHDQVDRHQQAVIVRRFDITRRGFDAVAPEDRRPEPQPQHSLRRTDAKQNRQRTCDGQRIDSLGSGHAS